MQTRQMCQKDKIKQKISNKFNWLSANDISMAFNYALSDYFYYKYPSGNNRPSFDSFTIDFMTEQWICQRMEDILSRGGATNATAYSENGVSWEYATSHIDKELISKIVPMAAVPQ